MPTDREFDNPFDDDLPSQRKKRPSGRRDYRPRLVPEITAPLPDSPEPGPTSEQSAIDAYLTKFRVDFLDGPPDEASILNQIRAVATNKNLIMRSQGHLTELGTRFDFNTEGKEALRLLEAGTISHKRLFDWIVNLPHRQTSKTEFQQLFRILLTANLGVHFATAKEMVDGGLAAVTLVDILGLLDESGLKPNSGVKIDPTHDLYHATDLEIHKGGEIFLIQIKAVGTAERPVVPLDDKALRFTWEDRMVELKKKLAQTTGNPQEKIHRILVNVPSVDTRQVEEYTGLLSEKTKSQLQKAYREAFVKAGFSAIL